ncbi:hypothetical protein [Rhodopila sp.]|uniref:hypothetical protein n=1 Tax=Rhodopila sp. TaxID=2480087 RepID=UPI003D10F2C7
MIRQAIVAVGLLASVPCLAQPPGARDPDWPCQQIKVPELSIAAVWSGPAIDTGGTAWKDDPAVADLVEKLAPRREPIEHAQGLVHDFAQHAGDQKQPRLLLVLAGLFDVLGQERDSVMAGLDRFGGRQKELAAELRADNEKLRALQTASTSDPNAVQQMTQKVTWEAEVFQDRRQALSYACDVPGKIEQRLFSLARQIQQELG